MSAQRAASPPRASASSARSKRLFAFAVHAVVFACLSARCLSNDGTHTAPFRAQALTSAVFAAASAGSAFMALACDKFSTHELSDVTLLVLAFDSTAPLVAHWAANATNGRARADALPLSTLLLWLGSVLDLSPGHLLLQLVASCPPLLLLEFSAVGTQVFQQAHPCAAAAAAPMAAPPSPPGQPSAAQPPSATADGPCSTHALSALPPAGCSLAQHLLFQGFLLCTAGLLLIAVCSVISMNASARTAKFQASMDTLPSQGLASCLHPSTFGSSSPMPLAFRATTSGCYSSDANSTSSALDSIGSALAGRSSSCSSTPSTACSHCPTPMAAVPLESLGIRLPWREGTASLLGRLDARLVGAAGLVNDSVLVGVTYVPLGFYYLALAVASLLLPKASLAQLVGPDEWMLAFLIFFVLGRESCWRTMADRMQRVHAALHKHHSVLVDILPHHVVHRLLSEASEPKVPLASLLRPSHVHTRSHTSRRLRGGCPASAVPSPSASFSHGRAANHSRDPCWSSWARWGSGSLSAPMHDAVHVHASARSELLVRGLSMDERLPSCSSIASWVFSSRSASWAQPSGAQLRQHASSTTASTSPLASTKPKSTLSPSSRQPAHNGPSSISPAMSCNDGDTFPDVRAAGPDLPPLVSKAVAADAGATAPCTPVADSGSNLNSELESSACGLRGRERLEAQVPQMAEDHDCVTVFQSDVCGFSTWAHDIPAEQVMDTLNNLYCRLDKVLLQEFPSLYKVETCGDSYQVAGNLVCRDRNHAATVLRFAIRAQHEAARVMRPDRTDGTALQLRIGIHSGPAVSGVVGKLRRRFCMFGEAVNHASQIEASCPPGCIQLTSQTRTLATASNQLDSEIVFWERPQAATPGGAKGDRVANLGAREAGGGGGRGEASMRGGCLAAEVGREATNGGLGAAWGGGEAPAGGGCLEGAESGSEAAKSGFGAARGGCKGAQGHVSGEAAAALDTVKAEAPPLGCLPAVFQGTAKGDPDDVTDQVTYLAVSKDLLRHTRMLVAAGVEFQPT